MEEKIVALAFCVFLYNKVKEEKNEVKKKGFYYC